MKRLGLIILVSLSSILLTACPQPEKKTPLTAARGGRGAPGVQPGTTAPVIPGTNTTGQQNTGTYQPTNGKYWGEITRGTFTQSQFEEGVKAFVSVSINPDTDLGFVSGDSGQSTGIRFWGNVETSTTFNPNGTSNATIKADSAELRIVIWDSYAGQTDSQGQLVTEIPIHIKGNGSGTVNGKQATVTFQDEYGKVTLKGDFDANYFYGWVEFDNNQYWDGVKPGAAGYVGYFVIKTCGFFRC